jgi:peptidoglycan/LPS O-acetylase OafA/YrhL
MHGSQLVKAGARAQDGKIHDIEVLRAFAVSFTLFGHAAELLFWGSPTIHWMAYSLWTGVDLFFCISGFVIARGLLENLPSQTNWSAFINFAVPFWIKRIFRIWPSAFFWLGATLMLTLAANRSGAFGSVWTNLGDTWPAVLQVENLHYIRCLYYKIGVCSTVDGIYWSLSLEEQFYCVFPILLFLLGRRLLIPVLFIGIAIQLPLSRSAVNWDPMWGVRTDALMLGILIAATRSLPLTKHLEPTFLKGWRAIAFLGLCTSLLATLSHSLAIVPFYTGLIAIVSAIMVFVASFDKGYTFPEGWFKQVLIYVGTRSYALYITHNPMYFLTREIASRLLPGVEFDASYTALFVGIALPLSFGAAELTFRIIETPLRLRGRTIAAAFVARRKRGLPLEVQSSRARIAGSALSCETVAR